MVDSQLLIATGFHVIHRNKVCLGPLECSLNHGSPLFSCGDIAFAKLWNDSRKVFCKTCKFSYHPTHDPVIRPHALKNPIPGKYEMSRQGILLRPSSTSCLGPVRLHNMLPKPAGFELSSRSPSRGVAQTCWVWVVALLGSTWQKKFVS